MVNGCKCIEANVYDDKGYRYLNYIGVGVCNGVRCRITIPKIRLDFPESIETTSDFVDIESKFIKCKTTLEIEPVDGELFHMFVEDDES